MTGTDDLKRLTERITKTMNDHDLRVTDLKKINYGMQFRVQSVDWSELVRVYQNTKGRVKFDYSQVKNSDRQHLLEHLIEKGEMPAGGFGLATETGSSLTFPIIGTDESGKGDYFGPLVVAGVLLDEEDAAFLTKIGVQDSKQLSDTEIKRLAPAIRQRCGDKVAVLALTPALYNQRYEDFQRQHLNLNALLAWGHATVIEELLGRHPCENVLSDQFADERLLLGHLQERGRSVHLVQEPRAESHIAVAAASIIAREGFVTGLDKLSKKYQYRLPKGAGPQVITVGKRFVAEQGRLALRDVAKLHFKTTERIGGKGR